MEKFCVIYHCECQCNDNSYDSGNAAYSESRQHEYLDSYKNQTHCEKDDLPRLDKMAKIAWSEIKKRSNQCRDQRKSDARSPYLHKDSTDYHHHEYRLKKRIQKKLDKLVKPCHIIFHILDYKLLISGYLLRNFIFRFTYSFTIPHLDGFGRSHAQYVRCICHRFGNLRISSRGLGSRPHHSAHERLILVRHDISCLIHDRSSSYRASGLHVDRIACDADERTCRRRLHVDICDHRLFVAE